MRKFWITITIIAFTTIYGVLDTINFQFYNNFKAYDEIVVSICIANFILELVKLIIKIILKKSVTQKPGKIIQFIILVSIIPIIGIFLMKKFNGLLGIIFFINIFNIIPLGYIKIFDEEQIVDCYNPEDEKKYGPWEN